MWDNTVVTAGGSQLLSQWVDGSVLNITGAVGGTGTVDAGVLKDQTALADQMQVLSIIGREDVPGGIKLSVQITAPAVGYTLNQIGILGNINGGATTLIAIYQDATGEPIPASSTIPDYVYTFYATITMTNVGELTVTVDPSALVTSETMASAIAGHSIDPASHPDKLSVGGDGKDVTVTFIQAETLEHIASGDKLAILFGKIRAWLVALGTAAFKNVGTGASEVAAGNHLHPSMRNILINWDFRNPVNIPGASGIINTPGYFLSRWRLVSGSVTINAGSITLNGVIAQTLERAAGSGVFASVLMISGAATPAYNDATRVFSITSAGGVISAAKLEKGSVSTLAYDPPADYGEQLALCQRYALALPAGRYVRACYVSAETIQFLIPLPVSMRGIPTIAAGAFQVQTLAGVEQADFIFSVSSAKPNSILLVATKAGHGLNDACLYVTSAVLLSAEY
jgi:hypothetical protein